MEQLRMQKTNVMEESSLQMFKLMTIIVQTTLKAHATLEHHVNLPRITVWCGISALSIIRPFFFIRTVTVESYLNLLQEYVGPQILEMFDDDGRFPVSKMEHLHTTIANRDVRAPLMQLFQTHGLDEGVLLNTLRVPLDFFLWRYRKDKVYRTKPKTIDA